jgi:UDP:flavonoid glycosyltransferase YjiC (YdhE family)
MLPAMTDVASRWHPDLILRDPCEYASAITAIRLGTAVAQVAISLADVEWGSIDIAEPALEQHHRGLADVVRSMPYVTRFPTRLDPSPFADTRRVREPPTVQPAPLPRWWTGDAPLIYATFGTVLGHMAGAVEAFETLVDAVADLDARVLLTVGPTFDPGRLGPVPVHIRVERWVDQATVLPLAALVVGHGGSGTTLGALSAGLPQVLIPQFADQFANAERVVAAKAGLAFDVTADGGHRRPLVRADAPRIREVIVAALANPGLRAASGHIAGDMTRAPTADDVVGALASAPR